MLEFNIKDKNKKIYFIGIGGVSMSAMAEYLYSQGFQVSGSDRNVSDITERLNDKGIKVYQGHTTDNFNDIDLVVYTDAISMDNEELRYAINQKIDIVDRAGFLGQLMKGFDFSIGISGTHGKTSTTSMLTEIIYDHESEPTIMLGGNLSKIGGNLQLGQDKLLLTEACEYKGNIEKYYPSLGVILNIDEDHLDYFDNIEHIISTFENYASNFRSEDILLINGDDDNSTSIPKNTKAKVYTFGLGENNYYSGRNIQTASDGTPTFDLYIDKEYYDTVSLKVLGQHNVYNAIAAIAVSDIYGIPKEIILERISNYTGVHRRLEFVGSYDGIDILDDYAHHPTEITVTLDAIAKRYTEGNIYCVFQPHTFTRTKILLDGFANSFSDADKVVIADIYAAREKDYGDIHSKMLVKAINKIQDKAIYLESFDEIEDYLIDNVQAGDCIITMGAGDVHKIGTNILKKVK